MAKRLSPDERIEREREEAGDLLLSRGLEARAQRAGLLSSLLAGIVLLILAGIAYLMLSPLPPIFALGVAAFGALVVLLCSIALLSSTARWLRRIRAAGFDGGSRAVDGNAPAIVRLQK